MTIGVLVELRAKQVDKIFTYLVPNNLEEKISIGKRVEVPFANQVLEGFILQVNPSYDKTYELKEIIDVVDDEIILNKELLELGKYMSNTTLATLISCYQVMLPKALKAKQGYKLNKKIIKIIELNISEEDIHNLKLTEAGNKIISILLTEHNVTKEYLNKVSSSAIKTLLRKNIIKEVEVEEYREVVKDTTTSFKHELTIDQKKVVDEVLNNINQSGTYLLHGVTGSGKTEVYMEIIEENIKQNKSSIVLVPEISLTSQMIDRFQKRFGSRIAVLHSRLSEGEKYDEWRRIVRQEVDIVIGARSAIFAPLSNIGTIIIDEEHTTSYKQENNPKYNAIDIGIKRSIYHNCPIILGSATPTLETYARAKKGVYKLLELNKRANNKPLPKVEIVNMANEIKKGNSYFSESLASKIEEKLNNNEQVILFLNRRGYSSFVSCQNCGYVEKCPNCDITLTYHKTSNTLRCHYCGYGTKLNTTCPSCKEDGMKNLGMGTERIEEELNKRFENAKVIRMDFDTTSKKGSHEQIINSFRNGDYNILLGTQMIAKGLDFPNVTLVGVINADTSLNIPDFRSSEYTFELLDQVSGRSGRGEKEGEVIIQTFNDDHYAICLAKEHNYIGFYNEEMKIRKKLNYPPFFYITSIKIMSQDYDLASKEATKIGNILNKELTSSIVLGPATCSVFKVNNVYRFSIIIKYKKEDKLYPILNKINNHYKTNSKVNIDIDFNPNKV